MASALNQLGDWRFLFFEGNPLHYLQQLELVQRPGVNDVQVWKTGWRGRPFSLTAKVDRPSYGQAFYDSAQLVKLTDQPPQVLIYNDQNLASYNLLFQCVDAQIAELRAIRTAVGGLYPPSQAWLVMNFQLLPVLI